MGEIEANRERLMAAKNKKGEVSPTRTHQEHLILRRAKKESESAPKQAECWDATARRLVQRRKARAQKPATASAKTTPETAKEKKSAG